MLASRPPSSTAKAGRGGSPETGSRNSRQSPRRNDEAITHLTFLLLGLGTAAHAQQPGTPAATVIAVPPLTSPDSGSKGNQMLGAGWEATQLIVSDLRQTPRSHAAIAQPRRLLFLPRGHGADLLEVALTGAKALVTGFVQARSDGRLTVGCYVYDLDKGRELARKGFVVVPSDWRRAAHKCSGLAYHAITGAPGMFDTRIAYVAENGAATARLKRIAIMDSDGYNHRYLTAGGAMVLTPRLSPKGDAARLRQLRRRTAAGPVARPRFRRRSGRCCRATR